MRQEGLVDLDTLEDAVLEQQRLAVLNLHFSLSEVLLSRGRVGARDVLSVLAKQGQRVLECPICDCHYRVAEFVEGRRYQCPRCQSVLEQAKFLDPLMVDAVLEPGPAVGDGRRRRAGEPAEGPSPEL
jgi:hypothetical protein